MVTVTEQAGALLERLQREQGVRLLPRLVLESGRLAVSVSRPAATDQVLYHGTTPVLRVAAEAVPVLDGWTIATKRTLGGLRPAVVPQRAVSGHASHRRSNGVKQ